jgi:hypothetical protein
MRLREDAQKLREKKTKLEEMVESHNKLIMQFADMCGYNRSDEDADDGDEHDDDGGNAAAPPVAVPPPAPAPPTAAPEVIAVNKEDPMEMVPEQEAPEVHEVILADVEPELPQPHLFNVIMRDYEESPSWMMDGPLDDLDDLDDQTEADYDVDE